MRPSGIASMEAGMDLERLWGEGEHVLCAVSGGADSVALLLMLCDARDAGEIKLSAAHLEHGIRGKESLRDAEFVRQLCKKRCVPLDMGSTDVPALAIERGTGIEQAAREARYAFLHEAKKRQGADKIALAHHLEDQAETVLMHLLRGAGGSGACGMRPISGELIRPLLNVSKTELLAFLEERGQAYVTDATNQEDDNPRNALRLHVMPELQRIYPGANRALKRYADIAAVEQEFMERQTQNYLNENLTWLSFGVRLRILKEAEPALLRRAVLKLLPEPDSGAVTQALALSDGGRASMPGSVFAERCGNRLYILNAGIARPDEVELEDGAILSGVCKLKIKAHTPEIRRDDPYEQVLDAKALAGAKLRTRREGDRFQMLGAPGDKLLSDVLIDKKIDRPLRDFMPLLARDNRVLWMPGVGISEQAKLTGNENQSALLVRCDEIVNTQLK